MVKLWQGVHMPLGLPECGPFPVGDALGVAVAVAMLMKSLEPGWYSKTYQQFETMWK
jgi:hypothetical protein